MPMFNMKALPLMFQKFWQRLMFLEMEVKDKLKVKVKVTR